MAETEWVPVDGVLPIAEDHLLDRLELLDEVTHALRGRLLRSMIAPVSVAELAKLMDVPVTRLYHHINRLEAAGLVIVVSTRKSGAVTEHRYRAVAKSFKLDPQLVAQTDGPAMGKALGALFDVARLELQHEVEFGAMQDVIADEQMVLSLSELQLTPDRQHALRDRIVELILEFGDEDGEPFRLFVAAFPMERS